MSQRQNTPNCVPPLPEGTFDIKTRATAEAWSKERHSCKRLRLFKSTAGLSNRRRFIQAQELGAWTGSRLQTKTQHSRSCGRFADDSPALNRSGKVAG